MSIVFVVFGWFAVGLCVAWMSGATGRGWRAFAAAAVLWPLIWLAVRLADLEEEVRLYAARRDSDGR